jgi:transposase
MGQHGSASASKLLGLNGFDILAAEIVADEWQLTVQTTATEVGCVGCGVRVEAHGRRTVRVRDLPAGGRPVVVLWCKRIWRCREPACGVRTWTERTAAIGPRVVLTERARAEASRRVGKDAHAVAAVARDLGVGWQTIMRAVRDHGARLVDDPQRLAGVAALGLDETSFLKATRVVPTRWVTGLVDLERGRLLDLVADRTRAAVDGWLGARSPAWLAQVATVALDPWRGYASALVAPLGHATVVVDHFHAIRLANIVVDQARRRTQQATLGHRGRKQGPVVPHPQAAHRRRRAAHRTGMGAAAGGPCGGGFDRRGRRGLAGQGVAPGCLCRRRRRRCPAGAGAVLPLGRRRRGARAVTACPHGEGVGGRDRCLPDHWWLLQWAYRGDEPADQEGEAVGHGFRNFANYRLRLLLHCGVMWQAHQTARLRGRSPGCVR